MKVRVDRATALILGRRRRRGVEGEVTILRRLPAHRRLRDPALRRSVHVRERVGDVGELDGSLARRRVHVDEPVGERRALGEGLVDLVRARAAALRLPVGDVLPVVPRRVLEPRVVEVRREDLAAEVGVVPHRLACVGWGSRRADVAALVRIVLAALAGEHDHVVVRHLGRVVPELAAHRIGRGAAGLGRAAELSARAVEHVDVTRGARSGHELLVVDADAAEQALERVAAAGGDRDVRHVAFGAVLRKAELAIRNRVRFALLRDVELEGAAPLSDLDDDGDVLVDWHVLQLELTLRVGERADHRAERDARAGLAAHALGDRGELGVAVRPAGDVDHDVVERVRAGRVVDLARDGRGDRRVVALLALAREALTGHRSGGETHARLESGVRRVVRRNEATALDRGAAGGDADRDKSDSGGHEAEGRDGCQTRAIEHERLDSF